MVKESSGLISEEDWFDELLQELDNVKRLMEARGEPVFDGVFRKATDFVINNHSIYPAIFGLGLHIDFVYGNVIVSVFEDRTELIYNGRIETFKSNDTVKEALLHIQPTSPV